MNTPTAQTSNVPAPTTAQIAEMHTGQVFLDSKNPVTVANLIVGDLINVWIDGGRKPAAYAIVALGCDGDLITLQGARGGTAHLCVNVKSRRVSLIVGTRAKLVARILRATV